MSKLGSWVLMGLVALAPLSAYAQDEEGEGEETTTESTEEVSDTADEEAPAEAEEAPAEAAAEPAAAAAPVASATARFPIRRGFFAEADLGIFFTFGGRNTNRLNAQQIVAKRSTSNLQPYLGMMFGYDVVSTDSINVGVGPKLALMLNGGAGIVSSAEAQSGVIPYMGQNGDVRTLPSDYAIWETGLGVNVDILFTDRLGLGLKVDGGLAILDSDPRAPAATPGTNPQSLPGAGSAKITGMFGVGAGLTYATLLTGFQVGLDLRFVGIIVEGLKAGMAVTVPIKYNF